MNKEVEIKITSEIHQEDDSAVLKEKVWEALKELVIIGD